MKIRNGFVSNSSSSSFIIIEGVPEKIDKHQLSISNCVSESDGNSLHIPNMDIGNTEFGWEVEDWYDLGTKLNFCALQVHYAYDYAKNPSQWYQEIKEKLPFGGDYKAYESMLKDVCKEYLDMNVDIDIDCDYDIGYIDHQSCAGEGECMEMFESKEKLLVFLFSKDSHIHTDNDNH